MDFKLKVKIEDITYYQDVVIGLTNLDCMAEQRLAEIYEMGYKSVEDWYRDQMVVPEFAKLTERDLKRLSAVAHEIHGKK